MSLHETFSRNLRELCDRSGQTHTRIAEEVNVSKATFSDWTRGKSIPRMNKIEALAEYFGCTKADLLEEKTESNPYYVETEVKEIVQELFDNPELRVLFSASRKLKKEDIEMVSAMVKRMTE